MYAQPDAIDRHLEPHNGWVVSCPWWQCRIPEATTNYDQVDGVKEYIDWAIGQNFGVMDVNIPGYVTHEEASHFRFDET
jgi:histone deacetylase 6